MSTAAILLLHVLVIIGQAGPILGKDGKEGSGRLHALLTDVGHRPAADADLVLHSVRLEDGERHWSRIAGRSAADGSFECSAPAGRWVLVAAQGGKGAALDLGFVAAGAELRHELTLREVEALQGLVLWPNGATAERAELVLLGPDTEVGGGRLPAISHDLRTSEDGRFRIERRYGLERLRARATVDWKIRRKIRRGWDVGLPPEVVEHPSWTAEAVLDPPEGFVVLVLDDAATISCRVRTSEGAAPEKLRVRAQRVAHEELAELYGESLDVRYESPEGELIVSGLADGDWAIVVTAQGYANSQDARVFVRNGRPVEAGGLDIILLEPASVSGRVLDVHGNPVGGVNVAVRYPDRVVEIVERNQHGTTTDGEGAFLLRGLDPGPVELAAWRDGAEAEPVRFELDAGALMRGIELRLPGN